MTFKKRYQEREGGGGEKEREREREIERERGGRKKGMMAKRSGEGTLQIIIHYKC